MIHAFELDMAPSSFPICLYREVRRAFAIIYTSIEISLNVCIEKPYLLKLLYREPTCMIYCRATSGYASYIDVYIQYWADFRTIFLSA